LHDWVQYEWGKRFGLDVDYASSHAIQPTFTEPEQAIQAARSVATGHPTPDVRAAAVAIEHAIDESFNEVIGGELNEPSEDDFRRWSPAIDNLIELVHDPRESSA